MLKNHFGLDVLTLQPSWTILKHILCVTQKQPLSGMFNHLYLVRIIPKLSAFSPTPKGKVVPIIKYNGVQESLRRVVTKEALSHRLSSSASVSVSACFLVEPTRSCCSLFISASRDFQKSTNSGSLKKSSPCRVTSASHMSHYPNCKGLGGYTSPDFF